MAKVEIRFARDTLSPKLRDLARTFSNRRPITRAMRQSLLELWQDDDKRPGRVLWQSIFNSNNLL